MKISIFRRHKNCKVNSEMNESGCRAARTYLGHHRLLVDGFHVDAAGVHFIEEGAEKDAVSQRGGEVDDCGLGPVGPVVLAEHLPAG